MRDSLTQGIPTFMGSRIGTLRDDDIKCEPLRHAEVVVPYDIAFAPAIISVSSWVMEP